MIEILTGIALPLALLFTGGAFFITLGGYPLRSPKKLLFALFQKNENSPISPRQALLTALAGTLGVGNISGVALAITLGGAGALFWMWFFALVAMVVKYAEIVLALCTRKNTDGGAMFYIRNPVIRTLFSLFLISCGFAMGNMTQVRAATEAVKQLYPQFGILTPLLFTALLPPILLKGKKGVFRFAEKAIPPLTLLYCALCMVTLFVFRRRLGSAFCQIFSLAFSAKPLGGALAGSGLSLGLRFGAVRGMISNEAGCGTAPIAHAAAENHPAAQGCLGVAEVFIDTILLCTLTGLCVLVCPHNGTQGTVIVFSAFSSVFGRYADYLLCPAMVLFAFATTVCWFYYTRTSLRFLVGSDRFDKALAILFSLAPLGALFVEEAKLFAASDLLICLMAFCNLQALIQNRKAIKDSTLRYFTKEKRITRR